MQMLSENNERHEGKSFSTPRRSDPIVTERMQCLILWHVNIGCQSHNYNIMEAQYKGPIMYQIKQRLGPGTKQHLSPHSVTRL